MGKLQIKPNTIMGKSFQFLICNQTDEDMSFKYEYKVISSNGVELKAKLDKKSYCSNHRQPLEKNTMKPITLMLIWANSPSSAAKQQNIDTSDKLKKLNEMLSEGLITKQEFDAKKKELLDKM